MSKDARLLIAKSKFASELVLEDGSTLIYDEDTRTAVIMPSDDSEPVVAEAGIYVLEDGTEIEVVDAVTETPVDENFDAYLMDGKQVVVTEMGEPVTVIDEMGEQILLTEGAWVVEGEDGVVVTLNVNADGLLESIESSELTETQLTQLKAKQRAAFRNIKGRQKQGKASKPASKTKQVASKREKFAKIVVKNIGEMHYTEVGAPVSIYDPYWSSSWLAAKGVYLLIDDETGEMFRVKVDEKGNLAEDVEAVEDLTSAEAKEALNSSMNYFTATIAKIHHKQKAAQSGKGKRKAKQGDGKKEEMAVAPGSYMLDDSVVLVGEVGEPVTIADADGNTEPAPEGAHTITDAEGNEFQILVDVNGNLAAEVSEEIADVVAEIVEQKQAEIQKLKQLNKTISAQVKQLQMQNGALVEKFNNLPAKRFAQPGAPQVHEMHEEKKSALSQFKSLTN